MVDLVRVRDMAADLIRVIDLHLTSEVTDVFLFDRMMQSADELSEVLEETRSRKS